MRELSKRIAPGLMLCAGLTLSLAGAAHAQSTFNTTYGGKLDDAARGGTILTSSGDILTVGESQSFGGGDYDAYVVMTDCCGNLKWAATYDLGNGGNDYARKVRETVDGNFVIVGSTENNKPCCPQKGADVFVMNIAPDGSVNWAQTYGGTYDDQGTNIELYNGGKEYVVSGRTSSFGAGRYDGYLLRIGFTGGLIWARTYGGLSYDSFNSLTVAGNGDIVACGETYSYNNQKEDDIYIVRVDANGNFTGPCNFSYHYGSPKANEAANDIVENNDDVLSVVGYSDAVTGTRDPYLLKISCNGKCICDRVFFNAKDATNDQFNEVESLLDGDIVAVGTNTSPAYGFGRSDVLFARINAKCDPITFWHYGMDDFEEGHSIFVEYSPDSKEPRSYIMAGMTRSCCNGGEDMYLLRADAKYNACCNSKEIKMEQKSLDYCPIDAPTCNPLVIVWCSIFPEPLYNESWKAICQCCDDKCQGAKAGGRGDREHLGAAPHGTDPNTMHSSTVQPVVRTHQIGSQR